MDKVFQEEQRKLVEIEGKIDRVASRYEMEANKHSREIRDAFCIDYEDIMRLQESKKAYSSALERAEKYRAYQKSPYFGRIDLDQDVEDGIETDVFYIGKEGIGDGADDFVTDWRTPIGSCYYAPNQRRFKIEGIPYTLALKRALNITNGKLINYKTEYDGDTVSLEGDVIDPFLLTVLKDKRRHNRLTDIIRTIQSNQNEIIRKPREESFVVQGCAGSGKTMILLHRLSFLKFNNRDMSLTGVKIITPNKYFDAHINDLSAELGLDTIERFSVEEYYVSLIKRYSSKIAANPSVQSEKVLDTELLTRVYSSDYMTTAIEHYHEYWKQVLALLNEKRLREVFEKQRIEYPITASHTNDIVSKLDSGIIRITRGDAEAKRKYKDLRARIISISKDSETVQEEYNQATVALEEAKEQLVKKLDDEANSIDEIVSSADALIKTQKVRKEDTAKLRTEAERKVEELRVFQETITNNESAYSDFDRFIEMEDEISSELRRVNDQLIRTIHESERSFQKTPVYNFVKRNNLRRQSTTAREQFAIKTKAYVADYLKNTREQIRDTLASIAKYDGSIAEIHESIQATEKEARGFRVKRSAIEECRALFTMSKLPDTQLELSTASRKECAVLLQSYEEQRTICNRLQRRIKSFVHTKSELERECAELNHIMIEDETIQYLQECNTVLQRLQFSEISKNVMFKDLLACYKAHNQSYQKSNYRHKLYLKLLYCSLYFDRMTTKDIFLNIDEAQDISIAEYRLLRQILGQRCVFNLYGDINQSVYSYKGITDWEEIEEITGQNIYVLNENYRNTLQITTFCNEEFGAEIYPIGISGEPVLEKSMVDAVKWAVDTKKRNPEYRIAILYRHGIKDIQDKLTVLLHNEDVSWYQIDDKRISVASVETAKGLEFEAVVAVVDQMSNNEKYISYTRALDQLVVVREPFASGFELGNTSDEIDDEYIGVYEKESSDSMSMDASISRVKKEKAFELDAYLKESQIECVDKRQQGGRLWIVGSNELSSFVAECKERGYTFRYCEGGSKSTSGRNAWYLDEKHIEEIDSGVKDLLLTDELRTLLEEDDFEILRRELIKQSILTLDEFKQLKLWAFMNQHDLYSMSQRITICSRIQDKLNAQEMDTDECMYVLKTGTKTYTEPTPAEVFLRFCGDLSRKYPLSIRSLRGRKYNDDGPIVLHKINDTGKKLMLLKPVAYVDERMSADEVLAYGQWLCKICNEPDQPMEISRQNNQPVEEKKSEKTTDSESKREIIPETPVQPKIPVQPEPSPVQKVNPYIQAAETIVLKADLDGMSIDELSAKLNTTMVATKQIVADSKRIVAFGDKLIHEEAFVDWEDGANQLEEILEKLLNKNNGYVSSAQLYSFARASMHMFLNDNDIDDERDVYEMAQHLFEKVGYHDKHLTFWMKSHISRGGEEAIHSNLDIIKKYAQDHGGFFAEEDLEEYLKNVGIKPGNLHGQMRLREEPIFFYYDEDTFMACENMKINAKWIKEASEVLKRFFAETSDHVILRDIETHWYMQMPTLPGNRPWTPLLLQSVLRFYGKKLNARTIYGMSSQGLNTVHAMIVHADSEVQNFCDAVAAYIVDEVPGRRKFEAEDLRQLLVQRGMIAGNELIGKMSKALANDERFVWDAAGKNVTVKV